VLLRSLREGIDYSTANGRMVAGICAALAAYKRELMHERASAARAAGRVRGRYTGRPAKLTAGQARQVRTLRAEGELIAELTRSSAAPARLSTAPSASQTGCTSEQIARHRCHQAALRP